MRQPKPVLGKRRCGRCDMRPSQIITDYH